MGNELMVFKENGITEICGVKVKVLEGGFGEGKRVLTTRQIAEIHGMPNHKVNELINNNLDEFENGIDLLEILAILTKDIELAESFGYSKDALSASKNVYILSEQGYMALVSLMRTDRAKEIRKQVRREYFIMREVITSNEQMLSQLLLQLYKGGQEAVEASKQITELEVKMATKPLLEAIEVKENVITHQKDVIVGLTDDVDIYTKRDIVNRIIKMRGTCGGSYSGRYNEMYKCYRESFHIDLTVRCENYNAKQLKRKDRISVIRYAEMFNHMDGLYQVACKLYEAEVKKILIELGKNVNMM